VALDRRKGYYSLEGKGGGGGEDGSEKKRRKGLWRQGRMYQMVFRGGVGGGGEGSNVAGLGWGERGAVSGNRVSPGEKER